jgi:transcriptional regulator with XRE-family HTH domain
VSNDPAAIGRRLREARLRRGLTQRQLSSPGVSFAYISRIEAGTRRPSVAVLRRIAPRLEVSVSWLETGRDGAAEQLARLVLDHEGRPPPERAIAAARAVLADGA